MTKTPTGFVLTLVLTAAPFMAGPSPAASAAEQSNSIALGDAALPTETMRASRFTQLDRDKDGYLNISEADMGGAVLRSQFSALDENNDGLLDPDEYTLFGRAD